MRIRTAFVLLLALVAAACTRSAPADHKQYKLEGQVLSVKPDHKQAVIRHEDIPGFMSAMTMPYDVIDPKEFEGVEPGDLITAALVVEPTRAYLQQVKKVGNAPLEGAPPAASAASDDGPSLPHLFPPACSVRPGRAFCHRPTSVSGVACLSANSEPDSP